MHLLICTLTNEFNGVEQFIKDRIHYLRIFFDVDIAFNCHINGKRVDYYKQNGVNIKYIGKLLHPLEYFQSVYKLIKKEKYDIVYVQASQFDMILYLAIKCAGAKLYVHSHNTRIGYDNILKRKLLTIYHYIGRVLLVRIINKKIGCSKEACEWLYGKKELQESLIYHNSIDVGKFNYNRDIREKYRKKLCLDRSFVVCHVGRFSYQKNHLFLLEIFKSVLNLNPQSKLLLIGNGPDYDNIKNRVIEMNLSGKVIMYGNSDNVNNLLQAVDCFALPSRFEGLPLVGVEAQAAGLPCFFSDNITKEVGVTDLACFIPLSKSPKEWAQIILEKSKITRRNVSHILKSAGFDINDEKERLFKIFNDTSSI